MIGTCSFTSIITSTMYLHMPYLVCDRKPLILFYQTLSASDVLSGKLRSTANGAERKQRQLEKRPRDSLLRSAQTFSVDETDPMSREAKSVKACKESGHCASGGFSALCQKTRHLPTPRFFFFLYADCFHSSAPGRSRPSGVSSSLLPSHSLIPLHTSINRALQSAQSRAVLNTAVVQLQWAATDLNH